LGPGPNSTITRQVSESKTGIRRVKCPEEKTFLESFTRSYKTEEIYRHEYRSFREALTSWETYRTWYRADRLHQSLHYLSPLQYAGTARDRVLSVA